MTFHNFKMFSICLILINLAFITNAYQQQFNIFNENDFKPRNLDRLSPACKSQYNSSTLLTLATMFDASVKIPNGIGYLNFYHLGDFDECYNLEQATDHDTIYGKYCLGTLPMGDGLALTHQFRNSQDTINVKQIHLVPRMLGTNMNALGWHLAYCIPSACTAADLKEMLSIMNFDDTYCQSKKTEESLTPGGIATVTIISIFMGLVVASTIFDVTLYYMEKKTPHELLIAFSAYSNGKKLITATTNPDQLLCLNGLRAISMMWVIAAHMYSLAFNAALGSYVPVLKFTQAAENMFIMGASVSVDTFFAAGGIVTVYVFLKSVDKGAKFNIVMYYIHRYLRLTPVFAVVIALHATVIDKISNGPLWPVFKPDFVTQCQDYWWSALLYIQNFFAFNDVQMCVPQSWYLSVDFQLFLLSPIVLLPLKWKPKIGLIVLGILIGAGIIIPFAIGYAYEIPAYMMNSADTGTDTSQMDKTQDMMNLYYYQTHTRFGPYVIGMLAGYFIYKYKKNKIDLKLSPVIYLSVWCLTIAGLIACVYSYFDDMNHYDRWRDSLSIAFLRNAWAVCICAVVFMCISGYGGIIDWFLSLPVFHFLTKLSYSMYLVHYSLITMMYAYQRYNIPFSVFYNMWAFWGYFMFTLGICIVLTLTFESPIIILEKHIFKTGNSRKTDTKEDKTSLPPTTSPEKEAYP